MNSTNTTKFLYSLNYSATIKYSTKRNSMCYKKAAPLNYSKNAFCSLYSDRAWGLKTTRFFYSVTFWLHRPLTVWWVPFLGLFTLFSGNTAVQLLWALYVRRNPSRQAASTALASTPERRCTPKLSFSDLKPHQTKGKLGNWGHRNFLLWNCASVNEMGCSIMYSYSWLFYEAPNAPACLFLCLIKKEYPRSRSQLNLL